MKWITMEAETLPFMLLFWAGVLIRETPQGLTVTLEHPTDVSLPSSPITLPEYTTAKTDLTKISCDVSPCECNLLRTQPTNGPFDVWYLPLQSDFKAYFVGTSAATQQLKYSNVRTYILYIVCLDPADTAATGTSTVTLEVDVLPNEQPVVPGYPAVTTGEFTGNSPDPIGTEIYSVSATDPDQDALTYTMTQNPDSGYFQISRSDGVITTAVDMRKIVDENVILTVSVSDNINDPVDLIVTVKLKDLNTRPFISNLPDTIQLAEDSDSGTVVTTLTFNDATNQGVDLLPECTVDPVADDFKFTYEKGTRKYKLAPVTAGQVLLDYETTNKYLITCVVTDGYLDSEGDVITLEITNVNEPPVFDLTTYYCALTEAKANGDYCDLGLTVEDPEGDTIITMETDNNNFRYDRVRKALTFAVDYDVDQGANPTAVVVLLYAVDKHQATGTATINVDIEDANDETCTFNGQTSVQFPLTNGDIPARLGEFIGADADLKSPNNVFSFEVVEGFPVDSLNYLTVLGNGEIRYTGIIPESNHGRSFGLKVVCKDQGSPPLSSTGTVLVSYVTTTSTTTTTTTTTTAATTTTTTTTTEKSIWEEEAFVAMFATLMVMLLLGLLVAMWFFCCRGQQIDCFPNKPRTPPRQVKPSDQHYSRRYDDDDFFRSGNPRHSSDYKDHAWRQGDHYEDGLGYDGGRPTTKSDIFLTSASRPRALPPPVERGYY